jgi:hypothetical protein
MIALPRPLEWKRGKSEHHRVGCSVTRSVSNLRDKESATEKIPPRKRGVDAISRGKGEKVR